MTALTPEELLIALHRRLVGRAEFIRSLENATIKGTPMVPLHVDTMAKIAEEIEAAADTIERLQARAGVLEGVLIVIAEMPYPGAPDIEMRKIARKALASNLTKEG